MRCTVHHTQHLQAAANLQALFIALHECPTAPELVGVHACGPRRATHRSLHCNNAAKQHKMTQQLSHSLQLCSRLSSC